MRNSENAMSPGRTVVTVAEAALIASCNEFELLRSAVSLKITVFLPIPQGAEVYSIDERILGLANADEDSIGTKLDREHLIGIEPILCSDIDFLVLNPEDCTRILERGVIQKSKFYSAIRLDGNSYPRSIKPPGQLHLIVMSRFDAQDCHSESIVPRCELSFFGEAELAEGSRCCLQSQDVEDDLFQAGEIVSRKVFAHCCGVFAEVYVEHPVQPIFDSPMTANRFSKRFSRHQPRRDIVTALQIRRFATDNAQGFDRCQHLAVGPARRIHFARIDSNPSTLDDQAAMGFLDLFEAMSGLTQGIALIQRKPILERGQQRRLVAFDRQQVIRLFCDNRFGDLGLATHRIDGHQVALDQQGVQQFGDRRDLVTLLSHLLLTQNDAQVGGKGADQVNRSRLAIARTSHGLAIHRQGAPHRGDEAGNPTPKGIFERLGVQDAKHPIEGVVRRNAIRQRQEAFQPGLFLRRPEGHIFKCVDVREGGADGDHQHLLEVMPMGIARPSRVGNFVQIAHQRHRRTRFHSRRPKDESRRVSEVVYKIDA